MKPNNLGFLRTKAKAVNSLATSVAEKVQQALVSICFSQAYVGLIAAYFCAILLVIGLYDALPSQILMGWFGFFTLVTLFRYIIAFKFQHRLHRDRQVKFWRNLLIAGAALAGCSWGLTGVFLYPLATGTQQTLIVLVLAGITAGAVPMLSAILPAALIFILLSLAPLIINLTLHQINLFFNLVTTVYTIYLLVICKKTHKTIRDSVSLQYENHALLSNLSEAKNQLELINKKLEKAATHDPLTSVANRNLFVTNFTNAIENAKANKKILALLYVDIDNFKNVNDIYGHHVGDQLLLILTERLEEFVSSIDEIARLGGDEFTIIVEDMINPQEIAKLAKKICRMIAEPFKINGIEVKVSASIGIGVYPIDGDDAEKLIAVADKAMYYVKEHGGNNIRFNVTLLTD